MMARRIDNVTCGKLVLDAFLAHGTPQAAALIHNPKKFGSTFDAGPSNLSQIGEIFVGRRDVEHHRPVFTKRDLDPTTRCGNGQAVYPLVRTGRPISAS